MSLGSKVLVIEDLVSTGGSSIKAIENVREAGGIVSDCLAIFSYGMAKSKDGFSQADCRLFTLTNLSELLHYLEEKHTITHDQKTIVLDWIIDPSVWGKKHGFE